MNENSQNRERTPEQETDAGDITIQSADFFSWMNLNPAVYAMLILFGIFILYQIVGGGLIMLIFGFDIGAGNVKAVRFATLAGQIFFLLIPTLILIRFQSRNILEFIRWKPIRLAEAVYIIIGVFAAQQFLQGYLVIQDLIPIPDQIKPFVDNMRESIEQMYRALILVDTVPALLLVIFIIAVVPSVTEEILFRGLVQRNFEFAFGLAGGAVAAGIIFGIYHLNPFNLVPLISLGIIFGMLVYKTGSIAAAILAHFVNNFTAIISVYYRREEFFMPAEAVPSFTGVFSVMAVSGMIAVICWILLSRSVKERRIKVTI